MKTREIKQKMEDWGWRDVEVTRRWVAARLTGDPFVWCRHQMEAHMLGNAPFAACEEHAEAGIREVRIRAIP
jgi:predicted alpha/beta hydrolase